MYRRIPKEFLGKNGGTQEEFMENSHINSGGISEGTLEKFLCFWRNSKVITRVAGGTMKKICGNYRWSSKRLPYEL